MSFKTVHYTMKQYCKIVIFILVALFYPVGFAGAVEYSGFHVDTISETGGENSTISDNTVITTTGNKKYGIYAEKQGSVLSADNNVKITTDGDDAYGMCVHSYGTIRIGSSADITTSGYMAFGAYARQYSSMDIGDYAKITTLGQYAYGAYAFLQSSMDIGDHAKITTLGEGAHGAYAYSNSSMDIGDNAKITTEGEKAHGVLAWWSSSMGIGDYAEITTSGKEAYGAYVHTYQSSMDIGAHAIITTSGYMAHGAYADNHSNMDIGAGADISTTGAGAHAVYANGTGLVTLNGAAISATGDGSYAVYALDNSKVTGRGVYNIIGDMLSSVDGRGYTYASIDLTMTDGSLFTGTTALDGAGAEINLAIEGASSLWNVTDNSTLTDLTLTGSTVNFAGASVGTTLTTDTLSDTGSFSMNTDMSSLVGDLLVINTSSSGSYTISVTDNSSGAADQNDRLTLVKDADGTANFTLTGGYANLGLWKYGLENVSAGTATEWQLYSLIMASDSASAAVNTLRGAWLMGYAETQTLIQRMGDLRRSPHLSGLWFRVHGGKLEADAGRYAGAFDMDYGGVQIGFDRKLDKWNGDLYLGAMFGYSDGDLDFDNVRGDGSIESRTLGVYGTYIRPDGFYLDAVLKYQWADNKFHTVDTLGNVISAPSASIGGFGMSLEAGKRFRLGEIKNGGSWYVEPQAQISYQYFDGGTFLTNTNLAISADDFKSLTGRVGALVGYQTEKANFYAKASIVKEFDGDITIRSGASSFEESFDDEWFVYGIGFTSKVNDRNSLYIDVERTSGGNFEQPWRVIGGWRIEM